MTVRHPWIGLVVLAALALAAVVTVVRRHRPSRRTDWTAVAPIANVDQALDSPVFVRLRRRYRRLVRTELALLGVAGAAGTVLLMQPVATRAEPATTFNRDVMLCLDVSGSMADIDASLLDQFGLLAEQLAGERIGLTIWNGSAVTVFPLTDDAAFVERGIAETSDAIKRDDVTFLSGTHQGGSSLIGDGLASCVLRFDRLDEQRSRSIVFATDNALAGYPIMTLRDATQLAASRGIQVYAVAPADIITAGNAANLENEAVSTDGAYFEADDAATVGEVVSRIRSLQAAATEQPPEQVTEDQPGPWVALAAAATAGAAAVAWWLRR